MDLALAIWLLSPASEYLLSEDGDSILEWRDKTTPQPSEKELQAAHDAYLAQQQADATAKQQAATIAAADQVTVKAFVPSSLADKARAQQPYTAAETNQLLWALALSLAGPLDVTQVGKDAVDAKVDPAVIAADTLPLAEPFASSKAQPA